MSLFLSFSILLSLSLALLHVSLSLILWMCFFFSLSLSYCLNVSFSGFLDVFLSIIMFSHPHASISTFSCLPFHSFRPSSTLLPSSPTLLSSGAPFISLCRSSINLSSYLNIAISFVLIDTLLSRPFLSVLVFHTLLPLISLPSPPVLSPNSSLFPFRRPVKLLSLFTPCPIYLLRPPFPLFSP